MVLRYDHPNALIRREFSGRAVVTSAATNVPLQVYQKVRLVACHCGVAVLNTNTTADASVFEARIGTDSVGVFEVGTQAVGITSSIGCGASALGTMTQFQVANVLKQGGPMGAVDLTWEYEVLPDAVLS